jgi:hypothetical protein
MVKHLALLALTTAAAAAACAAGAGPRPGPPAPPAAEPVSESIPPPGKETQVVQSPPAPSQDMVRVIAQLRAPDAKHTEAEVVREVQSLARELGARSADPIEGLPMIVIELPREQVKALEASPWVDRVQVDRPQKPY